MISGTGTNFKGGAPIQSKSGRAPPLFGSKSTISRFGERFRDGQCSLVSFLFVVLIYTRGAPPPVVPNHF